MISSFEVPGRGDLVLSSGDIGAEHVAVATSDPEFRVGESFELSCERGAWPYQIVSQRVMARGRILHLKRVDAPHGEMRRAPRSELALA